MICSSLHLLRFFRPYSFLKAGRYFYLEEILGFRPQTCRLLKSSRFGVIAKLKMLAVRRNNAVF